MIPASSAVHRDWMEIQERQKEIESLLLMLETEPDMSHKATMKTLARLNRLTNQNNKIINAWTRQLQKLGLTPPPL